VTASIHILHVVLEFSCGENEKLSVTSVALLQSGKTWNGAVCCERVIQPNTSEVKY